MSERDENLPACSHLQFAVLDVLGSNAMSGKELRLALRKERGILKSGPGFYQMMSRLEDSNWVSGEYRQEVIEGQIIKERFYTITGHGARIRFDTAKFYAATAGNWGRA